MGAVLTALQFCSETKSHRKNFQCVYELSDEFAFMEIDKVKKFQDDLFVKNLK